MAIVFRDEEHRKRWLAIMQYIDVTGDVYNRAVFRFEKPKEQQQEQMMPLSELFYTDEEDKLTNAD